MRSATTLQVTSELVTKLAHSKHSIPVFKETITEFQQALEDRFYANEDVETLMRDRARFIDEILKLAWQQFTWNENRGRWWKTRVSLLAVGGYGRGELHPHSDIDLLILLERNSYELHKSNIQSFLTLLWDIGLEVGHSVRSIKECKIQAINDVTVVTALMESRTICGDNELHQKMLKRVGPDKIWSPRKFFEAKRSEQRERHVKFDHTEYNLEPNIKGTPGGLRDVQTVMWIAKRKFDAMSFDDLVAYDFLTQEESNILIKGRHFLWKIRYGLHLLSGRDDDRLFFEHQQKLAELFGYEDNEQLAVELFMQDYYRTVLELHAVNELLLQHFNEAIVNAGATAKITPVNDRFQINNDYLEVVSASVLREYPTAIMEMFVIVGGDENIEGIRASTIRLVKQNLDLIDDDFRHDPRVTSLFLELLRSSSRLFSQLRRMARYGVLGAYLPEFGRIIGQMQFDLFHIYTVDAHTLQVIRNMRRFRYKNEAQQFPIAAHIHPRLPKVELLYIAGLYHDIAKGQGGDHSELGGDAVIEFCKRHHLGTWDTNLLCWLVRNHLVMSGTAQRRDISDPEVIHDFAVFVQDQVRLDYLYALTVADITATNPKLWNSWRASLMRQLYLETKKVLRHGVENYVDRSEYIEETQNGAIERLMEHGLTRKEILGIWNNVDEDYFLRESVSAIVWHTQAIHEHNPEDGPLILMRDYISRGGEEGATEIFIHTTKMETLFVATVTALDQLALDIVDARIASSDNDLVFDTFVVLESDGQPVGERPSRQSQIETTLRKYLEKAAPFEPPKRRRTPRTLKQFKIKTEVTISNDVPNHKTILEVVTADRPGLLAMIANIFVELDIVLQSAKITTLGERVEDVFYIADRNLEPIKDPDLCEKLERRICDELDFYVEQVAV
ncbi:MAG: [protein-PII] uridylyltransferase [Pseudomonadales bacterium]